MKKFIKFFLACFSMFVIFNIMQTKTYAAGGMLGGKYCNYEINDIYLSGDYIHVKGWFYRVYEHYTSSNHNYNAKLRLTNLIFFSMQQHLTQNLNIKILCSILCFLLNK